MKLASTNVDPGSSEAMRRYVDGKTTPDEYLREVRDETKREVEERRTSRREQQSEDES